MRGGLLVLGANSRVGTLLRPFWRDASLRWPLRWQSRSGAEVTWSLDDGAAALAPAASDMGAILCLAGVTPGASDFAPNVALGRAAVEAASLAGCPRVLLASTMAVYGPGPGPHAEDGPCDPAPGYGASKLRMEREALDLGARLGVQVTALRLGNVTGADMLFRNIAAGRPVTLDRFSDGTAPARSYIDPETLARVLAALVDAPDLPPVLNVAADPPVAMDALLAAAGVPFDTRPAPDTAMPSVSMDLTRLRALVPLPPVTAVGLVAGWRRAEPAA